MDAEEVCNDRYECFLPLSDVHLTYTQDFRVKAATDRERER